MFSINTIGLEILYLKPYIFFSGVGFVVATCFFTRLLFHDYLSVIPYTKLIFWTTPVSLLGAKLLGIIVNIINALYNRQPITPELILSAGIVYYGGIFAFYFGYCLLCHWRGLIFNRSVSNCLAVVFPLFHIFGRLGCLFAGCCYGIELDSPVSVNYTNLTEDGIVTALRLPTQLFESVFNILLFSLICFMFYSRKYHNKNLILVYFSLYSVFRFFIEFIRGDLIRGVYFGFSTSQFISLTVFIICLILLIKQRNSVESSVS